MRYIGLAAVLPMACVLAVPAYGQDSRRPDPDSPAGVEYQLPLEQARKNSSAGAGTPQGQGGGRRGGAATRSGPAPLFGAGIAARKTGGGGSTGTDEAGGDAGEDGSSGGSRAAVTDDRTGREGMRSSPVASRAAVGDAASDEDSVTLRIVAIAVAVLTVGGLLGLGLRRGLRDSTG